MDIVVIRDEKQLQEAMREVLSNISIFRTPNKSDFKLQPLPTENVKFEFYENLVIKRIIYSNKNGDVTRIIDLNQDGMIDEHRRFIKGKLYNQSLYDDGNKLRYSIFDKNEELIDSYSLNKNELIARKKHYIINNENDCRVYEVTSYNEKQQLTWMGIEIVKKEDTIDLANTLMSICIKNEEDAGEMQTLFNGKTIIPQYDENQNIRKIQLLDKYRFLSKAYGYDQDRDILAFEKYHGGEIQSRILFDSERNIEYLIIYEDGEIVDSYTLREDMSVESKKHYIGSDENGLGMYEVIEFDLENNPAKRMIVKKCIVHYEDGCFDEQIYNESNELIILRQYDNQRVLCKEHLYENSRLKSISDFYADGRTLLQHAIWNNDGILELHYEFNIDGIIKRKFELIKSEDSESDQKFKILYNSKLILGYKLTEYDDSDNDPRISAETMELFFNEKAQAWMPQEEDEESFIN